MSETTTRSGIALKPFYTPGDLAAGAHGDAVEEPGSCPYTRGRRREPGPWIHRELSGEGGPRRANEQFKYLLSLGQRGIDVIGDVPTATCMDPDHPICANSIGMTGVSLCRQQDYLDLYDGIPLGEITISNSLAPLFALPGLVLFCAREMPKFHPFLENTYTISEGGLDAVEEIALGMVEIRYIVRRLIERGLAVDNFAPRIALLVNCHMDFFETIAKIRAARRMYARMMRDEFGARDPRSMAINVASHTSGLAMTAAQPVLNVVRGASQALSLALAGVQAMEISTFDEAYRTPSPEAKGDPGQLADSGWFKRFVNATSERYARDLRDGRILQVGINCHQMPEEEDTLLREVSETKIRSWKERIEEIAAWKRGRPRGQVEAALRRLRQRVADPEQNLIDIALDATEAQASFGEVTGELRVAYGGPLRNDPLAAGAMMTTTRAAGQHHGDGGQAQPRPHPIKVLIAVMGLDQHEAGAYTVSRLLRDAGMEVVYLGCFNLPPTIVKAAIEEDADVIGISVHSWEYLDYMDELLALLRAEGAEIPVVLGGSVITPGDGRLMVEKGVAAMFDSRATPQGMIEAIARLAEEGTATA